VDHRSAGDVDGGDLLDETVGTDHDVLQVGKRPVVRDRVELAGRRIDLRVRGVAVGERAPEV
jgi:hypothetical protein